MKKTSSKMKLDELLEVAHSVPSIDNLQASKTIVLGDSETKYKLAEAALGRVFVAQTQVFLVFFAMLERSTAKYGRPIEELYSIQNATIACSFA